MLQSRGPQIVLKQRGLTRLPKGGEIAALIFNLRKQNPELFLALKNSQS